MKSWNRVLLRNVAKITESYSQLVHIGLVTGLIGVLGTIIFSAVLHNEPLPHHPMIDGWNDMVMHSIALAVLIFLTLMIRPWSLWVAADVLAFGFVQIALKTR